MNETTKLKLAAAVLLAASVIAVAGWAVSAVHVERAERRLSTAQAAAAAAEREAAARKLEAAEFKQLSDSLERRIADINSANKKLDEKLKATTANTRSARTDVERTRRQRTVAADPDSDAVCEKLAGLGHPC